MTGRPAIRPSSVDELAAVIGAAGRSGTRLEIVGGGSKVDFGASREASLLDMTGFSGVVDYDPAELVLTVGAGTPLVEVQALVASEEQMLAFEPFDMGPVYGRPVGASTIGGTVAAGTAGSRRLSRGSVRDHLLGFEAVSGRGERFIAGAKVVKNVTGYDLSKLVSGSWGRLVALTQVTLKVLPRGRVTTTLAVEGLSPVQAQAAMSRSLGAPLEIAAAAYCPRGLGRETSLTALRLEGFPTSVQARSGALRHILVGFGRTHVMEEADRFWHDMMTVSALPADLPLWRLNVPPSALCSVVEAMEPVGAQWLCDWAGGLVWLALADGEQRVRDAALAAGGHATLVRAPEAMRARVCALQPQSPGVTALEQRVRRAFDPAGVFDTGRFADSTHAD